MKRIFSSVCLWALASSCQAGMYDVFLSGGVTFSKLSNNSTVQINDIVTNSYHTSTDTQKRPLWGIGVGHRFQKIFAKPFDLSLNLMAYHLDFGRIEGVEHPFVNGGADFDTLNYRFKARSYAFMIEPHLIYTDYCWQPFVFFGVGFADNRLWGYNETPSNPAGSAAAVPVTFDNRNNTTFAYELGLGVQGQVYNDVQHKIQYNVALDYRYMNMGKGKLGTFPSQTTHDHLEVSQLSTQAVVLTLNASFC